MIRGRLLATLVLGVPWVGFAGPTVVDLDQALALAVDASPDLRALRIQQNAALGTYRLGFRDLLPKVSLSFSQNNSVVLNSPDSRSVQTGATVGVPVFDAGRAGRKRDVAQLQLAEGRSDYELKEQQVGDSVRGLFNQILVQHEKIRIQTDVIAIAEKQLVVSRTEVKLGSALEIDLLETESKLADLRIQKKQSERSLADLLFQLKNLLGAAPDDDWDVAGTFDASYTGLELPARNDRWLAMVLDSDKDLVQQKIAVHKQALDLVSANLWYLPDITVEGGVTLSGTQFPLRTPSYNAKVNFSFPIDAFPVTQAVTLGATPGKQRDSSSSTSVGVLDSLHGFQDSQTARANYQVAQLNQDLRRHASWSAYEKTLGDYRLLVEKLVLQRAYLVVEEKKAAILAKQVDLGEAKRVDYLTEEAQLAQARISLVESVVQVREADRALEQLLHVAPGTLAQYVPEVR